MILLDTHAWIWLVNDDSHLSTEARDSIATSSLRGLSVMSCWELAHLVGKGRIALDREPLTWIRHSLASFRISLLPLTPSIAVNATRFPGNVPLDPVDRIIAATANEYAATLVTRDARLTSSRCCRTLW